MAPATAHGRALPRSRAAAARTSRSPGTLRCLPAPAGVRRVRSRSTRPHELPIVEASTARIANMPGGPPCCRLSCRMSGGVDEQVRSRVVGVFGDLPAEFLELPLGGAPGEIRIRLREAEFRKAVQPGGSGERLGQEQHVGIDRLDLTDQPRPEVRWLGVRVVDPKDLDAVVHPVLNNPQHLVVEAAGIVVEVQRVDVLVLLGRVFFRVGDRAVGQFSEPLPVIFFGPRVIRGALQRKIQCDFKPVVAGRGDEPVEVVDRPEVGGGWRRGRLRRCRWPTATPRRRVRPSRCCCGPCGAPCRSDEWAADTPR